jgi:hypothetical protein
MCHVVLEYLFNGKRKGILLIFVDVVGVTTYLNYTNYTHVMESGNVNYSFPWTSS